MNEAGNACIPGNRHRGSGPALERAPLPNAPVPETVTRFRFPMMVASPPHVGARDKLESPRTTFFLCKPARLSPETICSSSTVPNDLSGGEPALRSPGKDAAGSQSTSIASGARDFRGIVLLLAAHPFTPPLERARRRIQLASR